MSPSMEETPPAERRGPETGSRRRRPAGLFAVLAVLALAAGLAAFGVGRLALEADAARRDVEMRLSELTGLPVAARGGAAEFHLLPVSRLSLADVRIGGSDEASLLRVERLTADLDVWQALLGRTVIERLVLDRPELLASRAFVADASGGRAGGDAPDAAYAAFSGGFGELMSRFGQLASVEIRNGVFRMGPGPASQGVRDANVVLSWPTPASPARMSGTYVWNDQPTELSVTVASPLAFLEGARSAVDLSLASPPLSIGFSGEGVIGAAAHLTGRLRVAVPSLGRAMRWLGRTGIATPELGPLAVEADLDAADGVLGLSDARVTLAGSLGQGALDLDLSGGGTSSLGGTLAFDRLDLGSLADALAPLPRRALDFGRPIALDFVDRLDMDLRVSVVAGTIGDTAVEDVAATVKFKDGTATLDVGDATLLGGQGQMRVSLATRQAVPALKGSFALKGVEAARLLAIVGASGVSVSGPADLSADIQTPVLDWAGILERNRVDATLAMRGGTLAGLDPRLFLAPGTRPLALGADAAIAFSSAEAKIRGEGTRIDLGAFRAVGEGGRVTAAGLLSSAASETDIAGTFEALDAPEAENASALTAPQSIGFTLRGSWPTPVIASAIDAKPM